MNDSRPLVFVAIFSVVSAASVAKASGQCSSLRSTTAAYVETISFIPGTGADASLISSAIGMWDSGCPDYMGSHFPVLSPGNTGGAVYTVTVLGHNSATSDCGSFSGGLIKLWTSATESGVRKDCGSLAQNLAHEIGHVLGLEDAGGTSCQFYIMADVNSTNAFSRSVQTAECEMADQKFLLSIERPAPTGPGIDPNREPCGL